MENIHCVDNHGAVRHVLPDGVAKLLYWLYRVLLQALLPAVHAWRCPIPVDSANGDASVFGRLREDFLHERCLIVIAIDQYRHRTFGARTILVFSHMLSNFAV